MPTYIRDTEMMIGGKVYIEQFLQNQVKKPKSLISAKQGNAIPNFNQLNKDANDLEKGITANLIGNAEEQKILGTEYMPGFINFQKFICIFITMFIFGMCLLIIMWPLIPQIMSKTSEEDKDVKKGYPLFKNFHFY